MRPCLTISQISQSYHGGSIVFSGRSVLIFFRLGMVLAHDNLMRGLGPGPCSLMINQRLKLFEITILDNYLFDQITLIWKKRGTLCKKSDITLHYIPKLDTLVYCAISSVNLYKGCIWSGFSWQIFQLTDNLKIEMLWHWLCFLDLDFEIDLRDWNWIKVFCCNGFGIQCIILQHCFISFKNRCPVLALKMEGLSPN